METTTTSPQTDYPGLYDKYEISYKAGQEKEYSLTLFDMFVLDLDHDPLAAEAYKAFQKAGGIEPQPYVVRRKAGGHESCRFIVLNASVEPAAIVAIRQYQMDCQSVNQGLFFDLGEMIRRNSFGQKETIGREPEVSEGERSTPEGGGESGQAAEPPAELPS